MRTFIYPLLLLGLLACKPNTQKDMKTDNPLLTEFTTPYGVPPFDKIKNCDYEPAFKEAMRQHNVEIDAIVNNSDAPTFTNTIEAYAKSGALLTQVDYIFSNLDGAETNDELQAIANIMAPQLSAHTDNINLNAALFKRIKAVYNTKTDLSLTTEESALLDRIYKDFEYGGANLTEEQQNELRKINEELSVLFLNFGQNVLAETNNYQLVIKDKAQLAGLPETNIEAAKNAASEANIEDAWLFTIHKPSMIPFLTYAKDRELRKQILTAYSSKGDNGNTNDNKEIINKITNLRFKKANLFGFENFASLALDDRMAKTPNNVYDLLNKVWTPALKTAQAEAKELEELMHADGIKGKLQPWDWWYYSEKLRAKKYNLSEDELSEYFVLDNVREGAFNVATKLYGITFTKIDSIPVYHKEVDVYKVEEADGKMVGLLYVDFHPRKGKRGGAWMTCFRKQSGVEEARIAPIISIVCNFSRPTADKPALLTFEEVTTLFHEFGHALHGLLSNCKYEYLSGTSVLRDFVELPSQIMENWAAEPDVLKMYAKHYKTGEPIPDALIEKLEKSKYFNQGFVTVEYMSAAYLDLAYHTINTETTLDVNAFETEALDHIALIPEIIVRYRSGYFNHIFTSDGYSAGYYSYMWAEVLDADAFDAFKENGIFDSATALAFRQNILEKGGTEDPMKLYTDFRKQSPSVTPLLKRRGMN